MIKIIAIETSTDACSAALLVNGEVAEQFAIAPRRHSDLLLSMVDQLLSHAQLKISGLDAIALGVGPGSFMGIRLSVGVAQGLAMGANLPVVAVSSLQALAERAYQQRGTQSVAAAWDARMGEIYWGCYALTDDVMLPVTGDHLTAPPSIVLPEDRQWELVGNAWQVYRNELPVTLQNEFHLIHPSAAAVVRLAEYYFSRGEVLVPELVEPKYLRQRVAFKRNS